MFQTFDAAGGPAVGRKNLPKLRKAMRAAGLDAFLIPHEDEYQNEYLPEGAERLAWATGFTGSAGAALVLADSAVVFVDGRYTLQARTQVDGSLFTIEALKRGAVSAWIAENAPAGAVIGFDPRLHSPDAVAPLRAAAETADATLTPVTENPVDAAWVDRPAPPSAPAKPHPLDVAGESHADKRARIATGLKDRSVDAAVLTDPASIAWLLNIRGGDVAHTPLPLGAGIVRDDGSVTLYIAPEKVDDGLRTHLGNGVSVEPETAFEAGLRALSGRTVQVDPAVSSAWTFMTLDAVGAVIERAPDPCALPRASKNPVEVEGARQAHARDGVAVTRFLHWLDTEGQSGTVDEIEAAVKLETFRRDAPEITDLSFDSISGAGPNGAVVHYRVTTKTNRRLKRGSLYLIDSGAQYPDGTTDVTRTAPIGRPSREMRERYTLVLKGHIALSVVRFPAGTTGGHLDALARQFLWAAGLDYDHGTGHGVGSYLSVHEGPQRIDKNLSPVALAPGMIVSNEPGFYKENGYGIRIENLQVVSPAAAIEGGERDMLGFETLTLAPLARRLIIKSMLTPAERAWVDAYHARVVETIGPRLDADTRAWCAEACAPL